MTQQLFDDLTADPPASTVDVPGIIRRERRRKAVVRAGVPAAAVLAVASAVAVVTPGGDPQSGPAAVTALPNAGGSAGEPAAATPAPGFRLVANDKATAAATAKTLRAALDDAVQRSAPGATWLTQGLTKLATPDGQPPRIFGDNLTRPADQMFTGTTGISLAGRRGTLSLDIVTINPCNGGALAKCADGQTSPQSVAEGLFGCQPAAPKCTATTGKDGRRQRVQTSVSSGGYASQETNVELADGRALLLAVSNQFIPAGATDTKDNVAQSSTPLSPAQVTATATTISKQILP